MCTFAIEMTLPINGILEHITCETTYKTNDSELRFRCEANVEKREITRVNDAAVERRLNDAFDLMKTTTLSTTTNRRAAIQHDADNDTYTFAQSQQRRSSRVLYSIEAETNCA